MAVIMILLKIISNPHTSLYEIKMRMKVMSSTIDECLFQDLIARLIR